MANDSAHRTLLVIEDDPDSSNLLQLYFTSKNYTVQVTPHGQLGLAQARQLSPDLVLLDLNLPDLSGLEVCRQLRASPHTSHLPIIFLTDRSAQSDRVAGLAAGAQDYVTKPYDLEELRLRIQNLIARTEREQLVDPRTRLPTGQMVDAHLHRLAGQPGWSVIDGRLNVFRPFVDVNGFVAGDDVLKFTSYLLRDLVEAQGTAQDYIGHPANEHFIIVTAAPDPHALAAQIKQRFDTEVQTHYSFMDREQGFIVIRDKDGRSTQVPLMTMTVTIRPL